jgi:hypothetical protein
MGFLPQNSFSTSYGAGAAPAPLEFLSGPLIAPGHEPAAQARYAENEVPHPHDFCEFGFTNTNPCCISVSW